MTQRPDNESIASCYQEHTRQENHVICSMIVLQGMEDFYFPLRHRLKVVNHLQWCTEWNTSRNAWNRQRCVKQICLTLSRVEFWRGILSGSGGTTPELSRYGWTIFNMYKRLLSYWYFPDTFVLQKGAEAAAWKDRFPLIICMINFLSRAFGFFLFALLLPVQDLQWKLMQKVHIPFRCFVADKL